ncbi:hypothetical protein [Vibrio tasmaniensis]|uniref:hypothetical protein n=1 Tax=Vibrio tasmaniensis TaxID=212663 RepID=UPI00111B1C2D|nr:hypothetical protein [Vibrio tasmaniensis]
MAQQNSTLTLPKMPNSDQRFAVGHESSPKNDASLSESQYGFIQLFCSEGVRAQCPGTNDEACFDYIKEKVWHVTEGSSLRFVAQTDYVHPDKFFNALLKSTLVKIYTLLSDDEPDLKPEWEGTVEELEKCDVFEKLDTWNAFDGEGYWLGTSEF